MAVLQAARSAQYPLVAEFEFSFSDTAIDTVTLTSKSFGSTYTDAIVFNCVKLPLGAQVLAGDVLVEIAGVGPSAYTVALGTPASAAAYLAASDLTAAAGTRYPLVLAEQLAAGADVRMTIVSSVANATAGKFKIRVMYTIAGRANEATTT